MINGVKLTTQMYLIKSLKIKIGNMTKKTMKLLKTILSNLSY